MAREGRVSPAGCTHDCARWDVHGFHPVGAGLGEGGEEALCHALETDGVWGAEGKGFLFGPPVGREAGVPAFSLGGGGSLVQLLLERGGLANGGRQTIFGASDSVHRSMETSELGRRVAGVTGKVCTAPGGAGMNSVVEAIWDLGNFTVVWTSGC